MIEEVKADPQLEEILRLHKYVQAIKNRHYEVKTQVGELGSMYDNLGGQIEDVRKKQIETKKELAKAA